MLIIAILITCMQIYLQKDQVIAASGVKIYNYTTKKTYSYTDAQIKVTYGGKKISVDNTPGLLENGIALVSYKDIFAKSVIKADCVYDKAAQTVSISKSGNTIVLKIGSKTAHINGKAVTAPVAPVKIKYVKENVTKILVPSRFVFENLGYDYTWNKSTNTVAIAAKQEPLLLTYNDGDKFTYNGTLGKVTIDGQDINLGKMPSIITNNTAMLRAKKVFADTEINAEYKYNSKDKSIILSRDGNVLEMKIGSPVAHLNNRAIVLDTAPMIVTNNDVGTSYVMVPGSITASCLGFDYSWDNKSMTSIITSREDEVVEEVKPQPEQKPEDKDTSPDHTKDEEPELGDSAVKWDRGNVLLQWEGNKGLAGVSSGVHNIDTGLTNETYGSIFTVNRDFSKVKLNTETYAIVASNPFTTVTSEVKGNQIRLHISNMNIVENTYYLGALNGGITDNVRVYNDDNNSSKLEFNIISDKFTYDLSMSSDNQILYLTIYQNFLEKITVGTNDVMDYITLTGNKPLNVVTNQIPGLVTIELPKTKKLIDDQYVNVFETKNIGNVNTYYTSDNTYIYLGLMDNIEYYIVEEGNNYTIMFPAKDKPFTPIFPDKPISPVQPTNPEIPVAPEKPIGEQNIYQLIIPNPAGLSVSQLKHEDQYSKLRFIVKLPGDYTSYFVSNSIINNSNAIRDISVYLNSNGETEIMVSTSVLQGYELFADQKFIYVKIGKPRDIYKNIVVLDPGHGGAAPGARYFNTNEKYINFKILYELGKDFFNSNPSQLKVYYTRETDVDLSLADRAAFADRIGADLFVSLHMNANTKSSVYGTEVYYSSSNNKKNRAGLNSQMLANIFVDNLSGSLKTKNRGIRAAKYTVVHKNTVPAVLVELGFMSNKNDFAKISDPVFQYEAAKEIYRTLLQVFELYPTGR